MVPVWVFQVLLAGVAMSYHIIITSLIVDSQIDKTNPIDLCVTLEKRVIPLIIPQAVSLVLAFATLPLGWPVVVISAGALLWLWKSTKRNVRVFDPMTIVRDAGPIKARHMTLAIANAGIVFYGVVIIIVNLVKS